MRVRREPPRFRRLAVTRVARLGPWMVRVTLAGPELEGFAVDQPASSVRLLLPSPGRPIRGPDVERQRVPPAGRQPSDDPYVHAPLRRATTASISTSSSTAAARRRRGRRRPSRATRSSISGPGRGYAIDPDAAGVSPGRRRDGDPRHQPAARGPSCRAARPGAHRGGSPRRPARPARSPRHDRRLVRPARRARAPGTRSSPPSAAPTSGRARRCGWRGRRRPSSASAATCSRSEGCRARRPRSGATGSTGAAARPTATS